MQQENASAADSCSVALRPCAALQALMSITLFMLESVRTFALAIKTRRLQELLLRIGGLLLVARYAAGQENEHGGYVGKSHR
jgi:hypothetical protein